MGRFEPGRLGNTLNNLLNASFRKHKDAVCPALILQIALDLVPSAKIFTAIIADDGCVGLGVLRNSQPDGFATGIRVGDPDTAAYPWP
jgi:hypothetical protein